MAKVYKGAFSGTLPITVSGTGTGVLASYKIYGNTEQNGTPTPENPIVPSGCGERTRNLFDAATAYGSMYDSATGVLVGDASTLTFIRNKFDSSMVGVPITISVHVDDVPVTRAYIRCAIGGTNIDSNAIASGRTGTMTVTVTPTSVNDDWRITFGTGAGNLTLSSIMLNLGTTPIPYVPFGYKLPLTANGVEYPIYLGDAQLAKDEYVDSSTGKIYRRTKNLSPPEEEWIDGQIGGGDGTVHPSTQIKVSPFIDVSTCEICIMEVFSAETEWAAAGYREMAFYDENKQYLGWIGGGGRQTLTPDSTERLSEFPAGTVYVRIGCSHGDQPFYPQLISGYTPTHQFYPYLVPTDPPAPFPQIPTVAGTTVIDYAGESLAPSQFDGVAGWGNLPVRKLKGVPYTGTLPATLQTVAGYLAGYKVYGSTVQDGTPTPENPIMPSGCGELETTVAHAGQYKLHLTSAGQGVDIYLGESQTTRRIGKIDLGTLNWVKTASENFWSATAIPNIRTIGNTSTGNAICDMFKEVSPDSVSNKPYSFSSCLNTSGRPFINKTGFEDLTTEEFKQAMSGIYMYYVLAEPETAVVNEPLMKIGDYADTIDSTQSTVQIPTAAGSTTISWNGEGLAPSQFDSIQEWVDIPTYTRVNGKWITEECNEIVGE